MRYFSEKILRLRFALVEEQLPPAIVLLESAALSTTLRMTHYFSYQKEFIAQDVRQCLPLWGRHLNFNHHEVIPQLARRATSRCEASHHCEATSLRSNFTFPLGIASWFFFLFVLTNKAGCITLIPVRFNTLNYPRNIIQGGSL